MLTHAVDCRVKPGNDDTFYKRQVTVMAGPRVEPGGKSAILTMTAQRRAQAIPIAVR